MMSAWSGWRLGAAALGAALALGLAAVLVLSGGDDENAPPTGPRKVCARDLIVRHSPGEATGDEPQLVRGETFDVKRYAGGGDGPHTYAGGVARGRAARGKGWVIASYLCDPR